MTPDLVVGAIQLGLSSSAIAVGGWWTILSLTALKPPAGRHQSRESGRCATIVPAHNEARLIASTVASLLNAGATGPDIFVVADNCTDSTAEVARLAGATVLERMDPANRGKSYALNFAIEALRGESVVPDCVVIIDADTTVSDEFFRAISYRIEAGASIVQAHYAAGDAALPVARLRRLAFALVHWARPLGASRLGLPTTLKGNGMAFRWHALRDGFPGHGITEDASATLSFVRTGLLVDFEPRAHVSGMMASSFRDARTQDDRWEGGRFAILPQALLEGVRQIAQGRVRAASACFELASPPLTVVVLFATLGLAIAVSGPGSLSVGAAGVALVAAYVVLGFISARPSLKDIAALAYAPKFVVHKLASFARIARSRPSSWERTSR